MSTYVNKYGRELLKEPASQTFRTAIPDDYQKVFRRYEGNLQFSKGRPCASLVARNEAVYRRGELGRFWYRRHFVFESGHSTSDPRFIGFFHMRDPNTLKILAQGGGRPHNSPVIAECYLRAPNRLVQAGFHILSGNFTSYYGILPLEVTPLVFPHRQLSGWCAHAAIHTAQVLMSDRGAEPLPMFDIDFVAANPVTYDASIGQEDGLSFAQIFDVLNSPEGGTNALHETLPKHDGAAFASALCGCIRSRLPVIAGVDFTTWSAEVRKLSEEIPSPQDVPGGNQHAVIIVGYKNDGKGNTEKFLVHDSYFGPWIEIGVDGLFKACNAHIQDAPIAQNGGTCDLVIPVPWGVKVGIDVVSKWAQSCTAKRGGVAPLQDFRCTLIQHDELLSGCNLIRPEDVRAIRTLLDQRHRTAKYVWRIEYLKAKEDNLLVYFFNACGERDAQFFAAIEDRQFWMEGAGRTWLLR